MFICGSFYDSVGISDRVASTRVLKSQLYKPQNGFVEPVKLLFLVVALFVVIKRGSKIILIHITVEISDSCHSIRC